MTITREQRNWARVAGIALLLGNVLQFVGDFPTIMVRSGEPFALTAAYAQANPILWRFALLNIALDWIVIGIASFALFVVLEPVNRRLAQLALVVRLGTFFIGGASLMFRFAMTRVYQATAGEPTFTIDQLRVLNSVIQRGANGGIWTAWMCQSIGMLLFYVLLLQSRYLPRAVAWSGIVASAIFFIATLAMFVLPQAPNNLKLLGLPSLVVELVLLVWFLTRGLPQTTAESRA